MVAPSCRYLGTRRVFEGNRTRALKRGDRKNSLGGRDTKKTAKKKGEEKEGATTCKERYYHLGPGFIKTTKKKKGTHRKTGKITPKRTPGGKDNRDQAVKVGRRKGV